jgi:hypothetical protein
MQCQHNHLAHVETQLRPQADLEAVKG